MRASRASVPAGVCVGVATLGVIGSVAVGWGSTPTYQSILYALHTLTITTIGGLIAVRHPSSPVGWILTGFGAFDAVGSFLGVYGHRASTEGWPGGPLAEWIGFGSWSPVVLMWILTLLLIPTGRLPGPRWRMVAYAGCAGTALYMAAWLLDPGTGGNFVSGVNPYARPGPQWVVMAAVGGVLMTLALAGSVASLIVRYRRAGPVERLQLKWVALAGLDIAVLAPVCIAFWSRSPFVQALTPVVVIIASLCLGAAVLWYRLFDVDLIVNRTVVYLALSMLLAAAYGGTVIVLGAVLGGQSSWTVAGGTLIAAVVFRPLRRRVQDVVDRRFARDRYSASVRIDVFLDRLRAGTEQPERIEDLLRDVLHDPTLRVLLLLPASHEYSDVRGRPAAIDPDRAAVGLDRDGLADVVVEYGPTNDPAHETAVRLAVERSRLALEIARLGVDLNRQLAELDRSRARIAGAADDERRRIQRDLHDGAQQRLVTVGISLRAAEARMRKAGLTAVADRLDTAVADLAATIEELRNLTHKLPPTQLDAGIGAAFRELAGRAPLPVTVEVPVERLDRHLEAAAYFVGCEGLTNVIKHARASTATLSAVRQNGHLVVTVADDGNGGAAARPGSGLAGLADRVQAAGGRLMVRSDATGTRLTAELPCA
ncbi:histidine kinase [Actinoplanes sp. NPDC051633]|uniref:sensor histidine kinase n=1 Tax=Actinoplanes sp. NPDC051633 TaxID=3155670 RepID=UPI00341FD012